MPSLAMLLQERHSKTRDEDEVTNTRKPNVAFSDLRHVYDETSFDPVSEQGLLDFWLSEDGLQSSHVLPCVPEEFTSQAQQGRCLYVMGVPPSFLPEVFEALWMEIGQVEKTPCVVDLVSEETFRWVIMSSPSEAYLALKVLSGMQLEWEDVVYTITIERATLPGPWSPPIQLVEASTNSEKEPDTELHEQLSQDIRRLTPIQPAQQQPLPTLHPPQSLIARRPVRDDEGDAEAVTEPQEPDKPSALPVMSWASVAGNLSEGAKDIDLQPYKSKKIVFRHQAAANLASPSQTYKYEPLSDRLRVVFLLKLPRWVKYGHVTAAIREGPLHSIQFGEDESSKERYAGVIFQFARHAEDFYKVLLEERVNSKPERFKFIVDAVWGSRDDPGSMFPQDETITLMGQTPFATRRLTLAKKQFFSVVSMDKLRNMCKNAGAIVETTEVYNMGNGEILFARVQDAVAVKNKLDGMIAVADTLSPYHALHVTFSKDPCNTAFSMERY